MEDNALNRHDVDWAKVRRAAYRQAGSAQRPVDTYPAIESAVNALADGHSHFYVPKAAEEFFGAKATREQESGAADRLPVKGRALRGRVGHLSLPGVHGSRGVSQQYVREGRAAVARANRPKACGWVIDLRRNRGGNMWPMLASVGTVLGDGDVGAFVDAEGEKSVWSIDKGRPLLDGEPVGWGPAAPVGVGAVPVAVLHGRFTASAGEAVAVAFRGRPDTRSFGQNTLGVPTGNKAHRLPDGAVLNLTEDKDADRTGRTYDGPIPPDAVVVDSLGRAGKRDRVLEAATAWLSGQSACRERSTPRGSAIGPPAVRFLHRDA
ncbi:S41 family peptidase [Streptomyces sp. BH106]|uniref:S41 family peptidase n=1 Tax=Streptomyces sp. BH106 TaxID=3410409 RepID=UPI003CF6D5BE